MKRLALKLALFLLLGAIINVAMAWGCAALIPMSRDWIGEHYMEAGSDDDLSAPGSWGLWILRQRVMAFVGFEWTNRRLSGWMGENGIPRDVIPNWSRDLMPTTHERLSSTAIRLAVSSGWPMLTMRSVIVQTFETGGRSTQHFWGIATPLEIVPASHGNGYVAGLPRLLPLRPLWPGFAINTIFYAAIVWLLFAIPGMMRRRMRAHRGRCTACGYDLRGRGSAADSNVCPECGAAIHSCSESSTSAMDA